MASENTTRITGDLTYENQPCQGELHRDSKGQVVPATCNNLDASNVLGVYAQGGDVLIGNDNNHSSYNAPKNVTVDGVLMSARGTVSVEWYNYGSPRGDVHLLGGVIEYDYGAFGTFDANTGQDSSGYSRKFTYDPRMGKGLAPPHFPTVGGDEVKNVSALHLRPARTGLLRSGPSGERGAARALAAPRCSRFRGSSRAVDLLNRHERPPDGPQLC